MRKIFASSLSRQYYHYDNREFNFGDTITGNDYHSELDPDVIDAYEDATGLKISSVLYMLDNMNDDYLDTYDYGYEVAPINKILKCSMDYSVIMCSMELSHCCMFYYDRHSDFSIEDVKKLYISLMVESYLGDRTSKEYLEDEFNYSVSDKVEYICQSAEVVNVL